MTAQPSLFNAEDAVTDAEVVSHDLTETEVAILTMLDAPPYERMPPRVVVKMGADEVEWHFRDLRKRKLTMQDERGTWHVTPEGRAIVQGLKEKTP